MRDPDVDAIFACPECLTVSGGAPAPCGQCGLPRDWLDEVPLFRDALQPEDALWRCHLRIEVRWPHGGTEQTVPAPGTLELPVPSGESIRLQLPAVGGPLTICCGSSTTQIPLPGTWRLAELTLLGRVVASPIGPCDAPRIEDYRPDIIPLNVGKRVLLGKWIFDDPQTIEVRDETAAGRHCVIVRQPGAHCYWVADLGSRRGTFVNRRRILAHRLMAGDLLQVGRFAWIFSEEDGFLVPVRGIPGIQLDLKQVGLKGRLDRLDLQIPASQLVAVVGPSGSGKSTFLKALLGAPGSCDHGAVSADGRNIDDHRDWYRNALGYVSQQPVVHPELSARQAVCYSARLRTGHSPLVEQLFRQVDLPEKILDASKKRRLWDVPLRNLSGGEANRVHAATELVAEPRLLLLDEPTTGLDEQRETRLLNLLRSLSYQGCTVVVVTHNLRQLDLFDRVLVFGEQGRLLEDSSPAKHSAAGLVHEESRSPPGLSREPPASTSAPRPFSNGDQPPVTRGLQFATLVSREASLSRSDWKRRLLLPVLFIPSLFALSLHWAVPASDRTLLGFLAVLACVWMGASLSLMSIVNEREVFDHERLLFLHLVPYVSAKVLLLWCLSAMQTFCFVAVLWTLRVRGDTPGMLWGPLWTMFYLGLTGWAAVGMGLVISALAKESKPAANFVLPLMMLVQIVFSVQVAGRGQAELYEAYGEFQLHSCRGVASCRRRSQYWLPAAPGGWLCADCRFAYLDVGQDVVGSLSVAELRQRMSSWRHVDPVQDAEEDRNRPNWWAAALSYLAISRYGDAALRSFAYFERDFQTFHEPEEVSRYGYARWRREAGIMLAFLAMGLPMVTVVILWLQTADWARFFRPLWGRRRLAKTEGTLKRTRPSIPSTANS